MTFAIHLRPTGKRIVAFEIVYLTFEDGDLDYIEDLSTFLFEDCGFRYVK